MSVTVCALNFMKIVFTSMYTHTHQDTITLASKLLPSQVSFHSLSDTLLLESCLSELDSEVSLTVRQPKQGMPYPNCHSHVLTSQRLLPLLPSESLGSAAKSAQPAGKQEFQNKALLDTLCLKKSNTPQGHIGTQEIAADQSPGHGVHPSARNLLWYFNSE